MNAQRQTGPQPFRTPHGGGRLRQRWRQGKGWLFAGVAFVSLALGVLVVTTLVINTVLNSTRLVAMHATADAGLALSLRSTTAEVDGRTLTLPYVRLSQVEDGSPAAQLGLGVGTALTRVAGTPVDSVSAVWNRIERLPQGQDRVVVRWVPGVETLVGEFSPESVPDRPGVYRARVSWVERGSPAEAAGLQIDDVLLAVDAIPVIGTRQAWEAIVVASKAAGGPVTLTVERDGERLTLPFPAELGGELPLKRNLWDALVAFITRLDEPRYPEHAGLVSAIMGTLLVIAVTSAVAFPLGIGAALYLEEYASLNPLTETLQVLIANLAGIPSVVYGIIGLEILARWAGLGRSVLAGGITLGLLILPVMIIAAREGLRAVPPWVREAAHGVGATRWQVVRHHVLPYALPGIFTGMILSLSRAIGEAAPLILLGAFLFLTYIPDSLSDSFTVIPLQIFSWATKPQAGFDTIASMAIVILLVMLLTLNALAIVLRNHFQKRW